jgi:FkbM family methyltransferase
MEACFTNDNNVVLRLPAHPKSRLFARRDGHEVLFRRIHTHLIQKGILDRNFVDLGAWIGDNALPWSKNIPGQVYAIDPSPNNLQFIQQVRDLNNIQNVKPLQYAVSDCEECVSTNDSIDHCSFVYNNPGVSGKTKLQTTTLDALFQKGEIEAVGYIHLDVEGMEYKIVLGAQQLIAACRPIISFEQHLELDDYSVISEKLKSLGYKVFLIDEVLPGCRPDCRNSFAFPQERFQSQWIEDIHAYLGKKVLIAQ